MITVAEESKQLLTATSERCPGASDQFRQLGVCPLHENAAAPHAPSHPAPCHLKLRHRVLTVRRKQCRRVFAQSGDEV